MIAKNKVMTLVCFNKRLDVSASILARFLYIYTEFVALKANPII